MEALQVAKAIEEAIRAIGEENQKSLAIIEQRAAALRDRDRSLAVEMVRLRDSGTPVGMVEKIAKGNIAEITYQYEVAEGTYKAHFSRLENLRAQLNGLQSINRYLSEI